MKHLPDGRTSAIMMCSACSHTFEAVFCEPLGKKGRALRAELGRLVDEVCDVRETASDAFRRCTAIEVGLWSSHVTEIAAMQAELAHCRDHLETALPGSRSPSAGLPSTRAGTTPTTW